VGGGILKGQFKKADRSGARYAVVLGEQEMSDQVVSIKPLRETTEQITVSWDALTEHLVQLMSV